MAKPILPNNPPFFQNPDAEKLVVFIHGIKGDPVTTWAHKKENFFWPQELAKEPKFKNSDVLSFGYECECGPSLNIREIAGHLNVSLIAALEKSYESISFVAHSMGGLVVREFILSHWEDLQVPIDSLVMLSTPNLGNSFANIAEYFCDSDALGDLTSGKNSYIDGLNDRWRKKYEKQGDKMPFHSSAGYEITPISLIGLIVEKDSAIRFSHGDLAFKKNHSAIAKPLGLSDPVYIWVKQQLLKEPPNPTEQRLSQEEEKRYTETITKLQNELQGTDLEEALLLIEEDQLDKALVLLSEREMEEDEAVEKIAKARFAKAQVYELKLDYDKALEYFEKAVQLSPTNSLYLNEAGSMLNTLAQYDKAIDYYEKALDSDLNTFGPNHPNVAIYRNNLGLAWKAKGQYDKAIDYYEKALDSDLNTFGPDHPKVTIRWNNLGEAWRAKGEDDKAIGYYSKALVIFEKAGQPQNVKVVRDNIAALKNK